MCFLSTFCLPSAILREIIVIVEEKEPLIETSKLLINSRIETVKLSVIEWEMWVWWKDSRNNYEL